MTPASSFLDGLKTAAEQAERVENDFRREVSQRAKELDQVRAFAHRRLNFMRAIAEAVANHERDGLSRMDAIKAVARRQGLSKREVYARVNLTPKK